ncbi:helix-turn-helix transcriptional regulator [Alicyclobacillus acidiphilus]|uniref:helix-turn-helix transcriptional regulator n=1 Tax=Alicyclobacillus acidiphilus TaxID=182455 RepID=UPI00082A1B06|nr:YafY family protein [Alicyclobacillus acidiphilus]
MSKSRRLIELMMAVNRKRKFTVKELAEEFGVSTRTMLRDLQELSGMGVPLYSEVGAGGGYRVLTERSLPPISFTENEAFSIFFACHALRHYSSLPFKASAESALRKFFAYLPDDLKNRIDDMRHRVDFFTHKRAQRAEYLEILLQASMERLPVTIDYGVRTDQTTRRTIQPVGIYADEGYWFCPAYCYLRKAYRLFRVDRIWSAAIANAETIPEPVDVREVNLSNFGLYFQSESESVNVKVKLTAKGIELFRDKSWLFPWGKIRVSDAGTGVLEAGIRASEIPFFAEYFFSFGAEAIVLEPNDLKEAVRAKLIHALKEYDLSNA